MANMKVLYIVSIGQLPMQQHIVDYLREKGADVSVEISAGWETIKFENTFFIHKHVNKKYDFIVFNSHYDEPPMQAFLTSVRPKIGFIDVSHDLFESPLPHVLTPYGVHGDSAVLTFHKQHAQNAEEYLSNYRTVIRSRWYKLDVDYEETVPDKNIDRWNDAIMIGNHLEPYKERLFVPEGFRKVWYKQKDGEDLVLGTHMLSEQCGGAKGVKHCADLCNFILSTHSSMCVESLLFGQIPIFLPGWYQELSRDDDLFSTVAIGGFHGLKIITADNLPHKLQILRDKEKFHFAHKILYSQWFDENYLQLPPAHEVIWKFMEATEAKYRSYNVPDLLHDIKLLKEKIDGRD